MEENNRVFNDPQSSINHATGYFHLGKEAVEEDSVQAEEYFTKGISILCTIADQLSDGKLLNDAWFSFLMVNDAYNEHGDVLMYEKFLYKKVKFIKKLFAKDKKEQYLEELLNAFDNLCRNEEKKNNKEKALFWCKELLACCFKLLKIEKTYMSIKYYRFVYNKLEELEKNKG